MTSSPRKAIQLHRVDEPASPSASLSLLDTCSETYSEVHLERERIRRRLAYGAIEEYREVSLNEISFEEAALALNGPTVVYQRHNSP